MQVAPTPDSLPSVPGSPSRDFTYELCERDALPNFDATMTVNEFVFAPRISRTITHVIRRYRTLIAVSYALSIAVRVTSFYAPAPIGRGLAPVAPLLQFPATASVMLLWRVEYVRVLLGTFEFWYFLLLNSMWMAALGLMFADARVCALPFVWLEYQNEKLMDAYFAKMRDILVAVAVAIAQLLVLVAAVLFDFFDEADHVDLVNTVQRKLTTRDVLLYTTSSVIFLMGRLLYRRRAAAPSSRARAIDKSIIPEPRPPRPRTVAAVAYQCKLVVKNAADMVPSLRVTSALQHPSPSHLRMRLVPMEAIVYRLPHAWYRQHTAVSCRVRFVRTVMAVTSLVACALSFRISPGPAQIEHERYLHMPLLALASTLVCLVPFVRHYSRRLLCQLATSFDTVVLSLKVTSAVVCVCDMLWWDPQYCVPVACVWLWWHWVLAIDALPPVSKARFGITLRRSVVPILMLSAALDIVLVCELLFWNEWNLRDRELLHFRLHIQRREPKVVVVRVAPFLLSRLLAVFVWTWRLVFRILKSKSDDDLILLTGTVEYELPSRPNRFVSATNSPGHGKH